MKVCCSQRPQARRCAATSQAWYMEPRTKILGFRVLIWKPGWPKKNGSARARQDKRAGAKAPPGKRVGDKSTPHESFDSSTPWSPPIFGGRGPQRSAPENHLRDNETSFGATVHGRGDRARSRDRGSRPRPPSLEKLQKRYLGAGPGNSKSNILELALDVAILC